ncbi:MAG: hypothetical protein HY319_04220 [Armatimonadetes bacterium]|nr:hypothetical protein [Armatimonadota bacterium]
MDVKIFSARVTVTDAGVRIRQVQEQLAAASDDFVRSTVAEAAVRRHEPVLQALERFGQPTEEGNTPTLEIVHLRMEAASAAAHRDGVSADAARLKRFAAALDGGAAGLRSG